MATSIQEKKIESAVLRVLQRIMADPDFGLELRPEFEKKLKKSITSRKARRLKDFREVLAALS